MPVLSSKDFKPRLLFRNGLISTIYPYFFRKRISHPFVRQRINTPDNDFFDIDWMNASFHKKLVILLHGLEGSSDSQYINGLTDVLYKSGYDIAAVNFRSCSGDINQLPEMYHSGYTKDLEYIISHLTETYNQVVICGFSLGGNVALKYAGEMAQTINKKIKAIAGISVPCDLRGVSEQFLKWYNYPYEKQFLKTLLQKVEVKSAMFPDIIDSSYISKIKHMWDFDAYYTTAMHNFEDAEDYYNKSSSIKLLPDIRIPTLIINAKNDSFLSASCYPFDQAEDNPYIHLMVPDFGGHVGFADSKSSKYWSEFVIEDFFNKYTD